MAPSAPYLNRTARAGGELRHPAGADKEPERHEGEDVAVVLVRLRGMGEQEQGDEQEQEAVAARVAQGRGDAERTQSSAGEQKPPEVFMNRPRGAGGLSADGEVEGEIRTERVEQSGVPRHRVEYADREEEHARGERSCAFAPFPTRSRNRPSRASGRGAYCIRTAAASTAKKTTGHTTPGRFGDGRKGQQHRQQGRGDELGHRLVGKADQLVPERAGYQRDPRRGLVQVPSRKKYIPTGISKETTQNVNSTPTTYHLG